MVPQHAIHRASYFRTQLPDEIKCGLKGANCLCTVVSGEYTKVIAKRFEMSRHTVHRCHAHFAVQVAQLQDRKPVESVGQFGRLHMVVPHLDTLSIPPASPE